MIGFYDYTVVLTYFSLLSAMTGIIVSLSGSGHPYYGCLFLLFCGLFDAFDGKVARTKKGRTKMEMDFGIRSCRLRGSAGLHRRGADPRLPVSDPRA